MMPNSDPRDRFVCLYLTCSFQCILPIFVTDTLKTCRKKLNADKMNFDIYSILNLVYFRPTHILNNGLKCILCEIIFSKSFQYILSIFCRYVTDIMKICMKKFNADKMIF